MAKKIDWPSMMYPIIYFAVAIVIFVAVLNGW